ncbi:Lysine/arginine/ornithine-binding periplasmic protein [Pseudochrobactrum sp. MP213Fo]
MRYLSALTPIKQCQNLARCIFLVALLLLHSGFVSAMAAPPVLAGSDQKLTKSSLTERAQIRFLTGTNFTPFNKLSPEGRLSGYNIDLIRALCQELSVTSKCQIAAQPWNELIPALLNNETDAVVAGIQPAPDRRASLSFTRTYFSLPARFLALKSPRDEPASFSPDNKTVGVISNSAHEALLKAYFPKANIQTYRNEATLYQDMKSGKIQLIFGDAMSLSLKMAAAPDTEDKDQGIDLSCCQFVGGAYPAQNYLGSGMVIALRNSDVEMLAAFNTALTSLERKGVLNDLYLRYFPVGFY